MADAGATIPPPLAELGGQSPPAPAWFSDAVAAPHSRAFVEVAGAAIEYLAWGAAGAPGLLLIHGNGAHADWWRFTAPFLADAGWRVAALSLSGMGNSGHRASYSLEGFADEAIAVADAAGLGARFAVAGHSFGGAPTVFLAQKHRARIARAIAIDTPFGLHRGEGPPDRRERGDHRIYPTLADGLARFRWSPPQPTPNLFIADFIAHHSLREADGGWTWKFDPKLWQQFTPGSVKEGMAGPMAPLDYMWGEQSVLVTNGIVRRVRELFPPGARFVGIPEAHHHVMADQPLALVAALRALLA